MWNSFNTADYNGMIAEVISLPGHDGKNIHAYYSRPIGEGKYPSLVLIPHMPGWDEYCREAARRFTEHGYAVLCPDIYEDFGHGTPGEVSARFWPEGGPYDRTVMEDTRSALNFLHNQPNGNDKVGVIGMCSGGRHTFLAACTLEGVDAAVNCWGGGIVCGPDDLSEKKPVAPIDYAEKLNCPLLGLFGNDDKWPTPEAVDILEDTLKKLGKDYEFHRYDGAGHGFWYYHTPMYRQEQAMDSFDKCLAFLEKNLK